ncbi:MAG: NUDIX domain-containing protein [Chloroflexi bacterium]|nr:NUDIX domain-containing protein [Chloroflexota bacterium]
MAGELPSYIAWLRERVGHDKVILTGAAACIRDMQGRVLLQKRRDNQLWGFPGGLQELGETIAQTACRETLEEVGLDVEVRQLIGIYTTPELDKRYDNGDQTQVFITFFECAVRGGELRAQESEVLDIGWFALDGLPPMQPCCALKAADARRFTGAAFFQ